MSHITVNTRKYQTNRLLHRKQIVVDIQHPSSPTPSKNAVAELIGTRFKVASTKNIFLFGFRTQFGGGRTTGFCLIYDSLDDAKKYEPRYRPERAGLKERKETSKKARVEAK